VKKDKDGRDMQVNSIYMMAPHPVPAARRADASADGNARLMAKPSGEIMETPINLELQGRPLGGSSTSTRPRRRKGLAASAAPGWAIIRSS